ncbi:MAG: beta/gamma crystallin-related protein [Ramlibacter sp.]
MQSKLKLALGAAALVLASQAMAQITFYEGEDFRGRAVTVDRRLGDMGREGFNDRASSIVIDRGRWEVCEHNRFEGRCVVLRRGSYPSLRAMGMDNRISSVRPVDEGRRYSNEAPLAPPVPLYEYRRRANERVYEAQVTSVRAVVGPPNQRCWVERQQVTQPGQPNVGGAIVGGLIGGVLGHQVGRGGGRDAATGVGVVTGAAIGANSGGGSSGGAGYADVQRCQTVASTAPAYWDVTYNYRGMEHRVQMSAPPGATIAVNDNGEPRQ